DAYAKKPATHRSRVEGRDFHQPQVDDRIVDPPSVKDVEPHAHAAGGHHAHGDTGGNDVAADRLEAEDQARQSQAGKQKAAQVEREDLLFVDVGDVQRDQRDTD